MLTPSFQKRLKCCVDQLKPPYKADFDAIYPDLAQQFDVAFFENFFAGLGSDDPSSLSAYFQADGLHPNAEGVRLIVTAMGPVVQVLVNGLD